MKDLLTIREVMHELGAGYHTVLKMVERGDLHPVPWGTHPKYRREEVERVKRGEIIEDA